VVDREAADVGERLKSIRLSTTIASEKHFGLKSSFIGVARDFNCECGAVRNRVGDRMSNAGEGRGEEGGRDADHLKSQFLTIIQKHYIENTLRTEDAAVWDVN
jgi:hypothetical protein